MISGYSFVSTIVVEIKSSNFKGRHQTSDGGRECLAGQGKKALTREIFTDCERAWDNDSFVLKTDLNVCLVWRGSEIPHM
jgi:hypothetical protein